VDTATNGNKEISFSDHTHSGYASSSHTHATSDITSGTLGTARGGTGITSNPSMLTNLSSTSTASVFATSPRPGITGTLSTSHGGTGNTSVDTTPTSGSTKMCTSGGIYTALDGKADDDHEHSASDITSGTLAIARGGTGVTSNPSMLVNLASTSSASVFASSPRPGITGTLPVSHGGTGCTSLATLKTNLGISTYSSTLSNCTVIPYGSIVSFADNLWLVVHLDTTNGYLYLLSYDCPSTTVYADSWDNASYANSTIYSLAKSYQSSMSSSALSYCVSITVESVTAKVFVPDKTMCSTTTGFNYFGTGYNSYEWNTIAKYNGTNVAWWSSTGSTSGLYYFTASGVFTSTSRQYSSTFINTVYGFRPCIALKL
jgi:hypothetical protein